MSDFDDIDFFRDPTLVADPYPYFESLREQCPVRREPHHDVVMVTGYDEAISVYHDTATFSSCNSVTGPFPGFPVPLVGDDVSELIEQHRDELPMSDQLPTLDPPVHTAHRGLLMRLITPKRLKENEEFMWRLADRQIDEFVDAGKCEFVTQYAGPFAMLVVADLLGVPEEDHETFRAAARAAAGTHDRQHARRRDVAQPVGIPVRSGSPTYIEDRRREPARRRDDGPRHRDVSGRLDARGHRRRARRREPVRGGPGDDRSPPRDRPPPLGERPELQQALRDEHDRIPNFVEESAAVREPDQG